MASSLTPIDWKVFRAATDDDQAAMKELAEIYLFQGGKNIKKLRSALTREASEQILEVAHRFLGSSRFFGATEISKPLESLLKLSKSSKLGPIAVRLVDKTEKEFNRIEQFFKVLDAKSLKGSAVA